MTGKSYMASCPICGRTLFKGVPDSYIEGGCPKCKSYLMITFTEAGVQANVSERVVDMGVSFHTQS